MICWLRHLSAYPCFFVERLWFPVCVQALGHFRDGVVNCFELLYVRNDSEQDIPALTRSGAGAPDSTTAHAPQLKAHNRDSSGCGLKFPLSDTVRAYWPTNHILQLF